jgi:CRP-like cAMP-binding protein
MKSCMAKMIAHFEETRPLIDAAKGTDLLVDSSESTGVFLIKSGKLHMNVSCPIGANVNRTAGRGEILGVAPLFCGRPHRLSCHVDAKAKVLFIESGAFLEYLDSHPETRIHVLQQLSADVSSCYELIRGAIELPPARNATIAH